MNWMGEFNDGIDDGGMKEFVTFQRGWWLNQLKIYGPFFGLGKKWKNLFSVH